MGQTSWSSGCSDYEGKGNFQIRNLGDGNLRFHVKDVRKRTGYVAFELSTKDLVEVMKALNVFDS
jgi:hypothetical protein